MPVKPRQPVQRAILQTAQAPAPISLHIIGEDRVREQGHMAKDIMEHVRFLKIVKLIRTADEIARYESPIGEMVDRRSVVKGKNRSVRLYSGSGRIKKKN